MRAGQWDIHARSRLKVENMRARAKFLMPLNTAQIVAAMKTIARQITNDLGILGIPYVHLLGSADL